MKRMRRITPAAWGQLFLVVSLLLAAGACTKIDQDPAVTWGYDTNAVVVYNSDWGVVPLPNDLLNNATVLELVNFPVAKDDSITLPAPTLNLPKIDQAAAEKTATMTGLPSAADSALGMQLKDGQNRLDGFVGSMAVTIPLSKPLDLATLVPYAETTDGAGAATSNVAQANLFFYDITGIDKAALTATDALKATAIAPDSYLRAVNWQHAAALPYYLTLRMKNAAGPVDFPQSHRYLVVLTKPVTAAATSKTVTPEAVGDDATSEATSDATSDPLAILGLSSFERDATYYMFAAKPKWTCDATKAEAAGWCQLGLTYIAPDASIRNNILAGTPANGSYDAALAASRGAVQQAEGARQITEFGLQIWQRLAPSRTRDEVLVSFVFSTSSNPLPTFYTTSATDAAFGKFKLTPTPADSVAGCPDACAWTEAAAACDSKPAFTLSRAIKTDSLTTHAVKLFKVTAETPFAATEVPATLALDAAGTTVTLTPSAALDASSHYIVAASSALVSADKGRPAADQTYFGLVRASYSLLSDDKSTWASSLLDNRLDALMTLGAMSMLDKTAENPSDADLKTASDTILGIFHGLDFIRASYSPAVEYLLTYQDGSAKWLAAREDLVLLWAFHTQASCTEGGAR